MAKSRKEKNENKKRRLLLLILLLCFTVMLTGISSYAWFTSNRIVSVNDLQVNVTAINGLEISADAIEWGTKINKDDLIASETNNNNQLPSVLSNVSSAGDVDADGNLRMYYGLVTECPDGDTVCEEDEYYLSAAATKTYDNFCYDRDSAEAAGPAEVRCSNDTYVMAFDIYLKLGGDHAAGVELSLTPNAGVVKTDVRDNGIQNTARVAFVEQGHLSTEEYLDGVPVLDSEGNPTTNEDGSPVLTPGSTAIGAMKKGTKAIIWEPNSNGHTQRGLDNAKKYGIVYNGESKLDYIGIMEPFENIPLYHVTADPYSVHFKQPETIIYSTENNTTATNTGIILQNGVTKFRVYFWVEGQDIDTENYAAGSNMKLNLEFSIPEA